MTPPSSERSESVAERLASLHAGVGQRLRARREEQGLSLRGLARRLEISPSALSQIETGKSRPSVSTLYAIVSELGLSLDELFGSIDGGRERAGPRAGDAATEAGGGEPRVQRAGSRHAIDLETGVRWERLTATADPDVDFLAVTYDVGGASSQSDVLVRHGGREYGIVFSGTLEVTVGFDTYELGPGDSISFDSTTPHRLRNVSDVPVTGIWFVIGRHGSDSRSTRLRA